jgi:hypothetical protein
MAKRKNKDLQNTEVVDPEPLFQEWYHQKVCFSSGLYVEVVLEGRLQHSVLPLFQ